jgi:hypothetical protein
MTRRTVVSAWMLGGLVALVFLAVLVSPAAQKGRSSSSYSAAADGVRLAHDLVGRLGWSPERRDVAFSDALSDPAPIQVLVNASVSDAEAGSLLAFVRDGGSLLIAGGGGSLPDSLGAVSRTGGKFVVADYEPHCESRGTWQTELAQANYGAALDWSRPAPLDTVGFGTVVFASRDDKRETLARAGAGFPYGAGRIVLVADEGFLANDVIRRCELRTDAEYVRMVEYLSRGRRGLRVAFDEFHHGYGVRGGSFTAIRRYLTGTPSGNMLAQVAIAGLILLFAAAPRPLAPRDPSHVARRSPLEHADALAHAYASVNATRTATSRLLAGVRRRSRVRVRGNDADAAFLATVSAISPAAAKAASVVADALERPLPSRQLPEVATALDTLEQELSRPPSTRR